MGNRRRKRLKVRIGSRTLLFLVVSSTVGTVRVEGENVESIPNEFVFEMDGGDGEVPGKLDWIDGRRAQIVVGPSTMASA
jgi:hypothetical protein